MFVVNFKLDFKKIFLVCILVAAIIATIIEFGNNNSKVVNANLDNNYDFVLTEDNILLY